jgi:hypothetical protein
MTLTEPRNTELVKQVLLGLVPMDEKNKATAKRKISGMQPQALTNLWHGIITGMKLFNEGNSKATSVPAIYILTDGAPNHLCPAQGYVTKLRSMKIPASIHTFGFGYSLRSGLLKSIAEIGGGGYAFIPDAGMIGTVFVHAVANLQSTFGVEATLTLKSQVPLVETMGTTVKQKDAERVDTLDGPVYRLTVSLGKIQYGQSRDIFLRFSKPSMPEESSVSALLQFSSVTGGSQSVGTTLDLNGLPEPPQDVIYHQARAHICSFLSSLFPIQPDGEHVYENTVTLAVREKLNELKSEFAAAGMEESLAPLLGDLNGQISIALSRDDYFRKWGCHYLSSLLSSHESQSCNSFKDPGPLEYGKNSPLFIKCRDELDNAFDNLPPPEPSRKTSRPRSVKMSKYNRSSNPCFAGFCKVVLANGNTLPLSRLRPGMQVLTPVGSRNVSAVLKTRVRNEQAQMCWVGNELLVTPYHPISLDGGRTWVFPIDVAKTTSTVAGGLSVYSVLLQPDKDERAHGIIVGDCLGITLGHGDVEAVASNDVTSHAFFGDYKRVARSMRRLPKDKNGVFIGRGVKRNRAGLVCGFKTSSKG